MTRADMLRTVSPHFVADVVMYASGEGGRQSAAVLGWGCPCTISQMHPLVGYGAWLLLGDEPLEPGSHRRLGFWSPVDESAETLRRAGRFYLWEGGFIGEATVLPE
jgi:hypothetical protein